MLVVGEDAMKVEEAKEELASFLIELLLEERIDGNGESVSDDTGSPMNGGR